MTHAQGEKLGAINRVGDLNENEVYKPKMESISEFANEHTRFTNARQIIKDAAKAQAAAQEKVASTVDPSKIALGKIVYKYIRRGYRLANSLGKTDLANSLHFPITYITNAPKDKAIDRTNALIKVLDTNKLIPLTNIKASDILLINAAVTDYTGTKDLPIESIQAKKVQGTDTLPQAFNTAIDAMNAICDYADSYFGDSEELVDKQMVAAYMLAKQYIPAGHKNTGILGQALKANGQPSINSSIHIVDTDKYAITDYLGNYSLAHVTPGFYTVTCKTEGGDEVTKTVFIHQGVMEELDFIIV